MAGSGGGAAIDVPPSPLHACGRAADGAAQESHRIGADMAALADHDTASDTETVEALGAAEAGRGRIDAVIAAAVADVAALGLATNTPAGQRALVTAIKRHLQETRATVDQHDADAQTRAAGASATAARYSVVGRPNPVGWAPAMAGTATMPAGMGTGAPMSGMSALPLGPLGGLTSVFAHRPTSRAVEASPLPDGMVSGGGSPAAAIPVSEVRYDRDGFATGPEAYRGYIAKALDIIGITKPTARANWSRGLMVGLSRESSYDPLAVNTWDANARGARAPDGYPANCDRGGTQMIPPTFAAHHQPGTSTDIYDPVAGLCATVNTLMQQYHVLADGSNISAVPQFNPHHAPQGW